jgi:type I restriction enzyme M protein
MKVGRRVLRHACTAEILAEIFKPFACRVYGLSCGSGGLFVKSARLAENRQGSLISPSVYRQDSNPTAWNLCQTNLASRRLEAD